MEDMDVMVHSLVQHLPISVGKQEDIRRATSEDVAIQQVLSFVRNGWPNSKKSLPINLRQFWDLKDDLYEAEGIVFVGTRVYIPQQLRKEILDILHQSHLGIEKTRLQAREILFWPHMSQEIEDKIQHCAICQQHAAEQRKEKMIPHEVPNRPWEKIGVDLFHFAGKDYLCVVDYFSKFPIVRLLSSKTASSVINQLKSIFSEHGIPDEVVSDNMPFNSANFIGFSQSYGFKSTTSSPTYSQSNGQVERMIGVVKQILRKCEDPYIAMLEYRNTPLKHANYSPSQLLNSRRLRSKLPVSAKLLQPAVVFNAKSILQTSQKYMIDQYNQTARNMPPLVEKETVWLRDNNTWQPAIVRQQHEAPRSYIVENEKGSMLRRNRRHLKRGNPPFGTDPVTVLETAHSELPSQYSNDTIVPSPQKPMARDMSVTPKTNNLTYTRSGRISKPPNRLDL